MPVPTLNNRSAELWIGATVGGSSAINGQFFDCTSRYDYDDWDRLAGEPSGDGNASDGARWDWDSLLPYFKNLRPYKLLCNVVSSTTADFDFGGQSVTFIEPEKEIVEALNLTWDYDAAYGGSTPIFSSFVPFQWPLAGK